MEAKSISSALTKLVQGDPLLSPIFTKYIGKEKWTTAECQEVVNRLTDLLWNENYTLKTAELFSPLLLELLTRASNIPEEESMDCYARHEWLCICLSKLIWNSPEIGRFTRVYFEKARNLFWRYEGEDQPPPAKKAKTEAVAPHTHQLLKAGYLFLIYDTPYFKDLWSWAVIVKFLKDRDVRSRWFAHQCLIRVGHLKDSELSFVLKDHFTEEELLNCTKEDFELSSLWNLKPNLHTLEETYKNEQLSNLDRLPTETINICGVLLNRCHDTEDPQPLKMICVDSVNQALHALALAVASSEPVLLQGPVGCGKTSLVEHLALLTKRSPLENFMKIQLGDHVDGKMLLGAHVCTEIPGQFIWKPGILVRAMIQGHWLLIEDIDCAPMDVVSLIVPVLQTRTLVLPGYSFPIKAAPGFQLFATQRLLSGLGGSYLEFRNNGEIIDSLWRKVVINSLSRTELTQVISTKWSDLMPIIPRILAVYSLFSTDLIDAQSDIDCGDIHVPLNTFCRYGRLISMRDLFKFCDRIAKGFDSTATETAINVFKNALECFCDSIPNPDTRLIAAVAIATHFNLPKAKAVYICHKNKPEVKKTDPVTIGRAFLPMVPPTSISFSRPHRSVFAQTRQAVSLLEKVAVCVLNKEPVLLVGETGNGKTSIVQHLAELTNHKLTVINMSQQSDSVDLIGGFKPVDMILAVQPIRDEFDDLFRRGVSVEKNAKFLQHVANCFQRRRYDQLFSLMSHAEKNIVELFIKKYMSSGQHLEMVGRWRKLMEKIRLLKNQIEQSKTTLAFKYMEGALIKAMSNGEWILLDEINLAEAETLECLVGVLEKDDNALILLEKGENEAVTRHPDFHVFACMNPATDVGKKDLPTGIRSRFTEFFVEEITEKSDFLILVHEYLKTLTLNTSVIENVVDFYNHIKTAAAKNLSDGTGHNPHYSLRTLCRALKYASSNPCHNIPRSLYEAFCLSFLSQLDNASHKLVIHAITSRLLEKKHLSILKQSIPEPGTGRYTEIAGYWIMSGDEEVESQEHYIFTETVTRNLQDIARIVSAARYPVLLQGETSSGKTSLIQYLAKATGNVCVRINNHEHTDIQEYIGTYNADEKGTLVFKEGILVEAMRNGHWVILDELNLAPTEVMEALNRVLDDNRELFIAETQTLVKAHPRFMIFATQNPPGHYGGRKILSRAFRNRFIELHFNEIPAPELEIILEKRCGVPPSYSKKLVAVMQELQVRRRESGVFAGKRGFITLRDLFRWGERYELAPDPPKYYDWRQHLADEGFLLLAGRVRLQEEVRVIREVIAKHLEREADPTSLFYLSENTSFVTKDILTRALQTPLPSAFSNIVWTYNMRKLAVLVGKAMQYNEPVLLVGNTGCGKTTICQIYGAIFNTDLHSVNCHMHTESSDFLGGLRPVRDAKQREVKLFDWVDGPLIKAMNEGSFFLADEISLADDSVLERLNSVLEQEQKLFLSEKSLDGCSSYEIVAKDGFHFFATMNPGGDYGKKELSPALRNRFTEIWCPSNLLIESDVIEIVDHNINKRIRNEFKFGIKIAEFLKFYSETEFGRLTTITMRDIMTWVEFINAVTVKVLPPREAYLHGAFLVFLDSIGSGHTATSNQSGLQKMKEKFFTFLGKQAGGQNEIESVMLLIPEMVERFSEVHLGVSERGPKRFEIGPFYTKLGPHSNLFNPQSYILKAKTTKANALRLLRAMQLSKPILLEGSPGVGKTSLVDALAKVSGHKLVRINLSEQTDISDLFGADLPVEGGETGEFDWRDGPLLQALKQGHWILLDELNLASQSVLEGLNACLDHRSEVYISELGMTFPINRTSSRIFGCQNPYRQGGSRKGLPRSFLNRFTQVYVRPMDASDLLYITKNVYPDIPQELIVTMIAFNAEVDKLVNEQTACGTRGAPFEFNLRDIFRWCDAIHHSQSQTKFNIGEHIKLIYADRMRTPEDKSKIYALYEDLINKQKMTKEHCVLNRFLDLNIYEDTMQLGYSSIETGGRNCSDTSITCISPGQLSTLESLMKCVEMNWMPILIGTSGSGKSTLIRLLAELSGHQLHIMSVNSEMDTIELLGGFEQVDINRKVESVAQDLEPIIHEAILQCIHPSVIANECNRLEEILTQMHLLATVKGNTSTDSGCKAKLRCLLELISSLEDLHMPEAQKLLSYSKEIVQTLSDKVMNGDSTTCSGQFEWVDSVLIHAVSKGHWLLVDDANFCSSSVLDRLNSLLEPNGVLVVSEQGVVGKDLRTITPHPDFRIFLTMNSNNGEISRAMRNRGVEIFVDPVNVDFVSWRRCLDTTSFAQCKGLVHSGLVCHLTTIHRCLVESRECETPTISDFLSAATLCAQLLRKHEEPKTALLKSCLTVYAKNNFNANSRKTIIDCINFNISRAPKLCRDSNLPVTSLLPTTLDYRHNAAFAAVKKQTAFFSYYLNFLERREAGDEMMPLSYPAPDLPSDIPNKERLFCIIRIMFESTSIELHKILDTWLQFTIENELKSKTLHHLKEDLHPCLQLKTMLIEQLKDPIVLELLNVVGEICQHSGFRAIKKSEFSIDPRWRPDAYRRLLYHLERFSESDGDSSIEIEMIEYKISSCANKFNLLLLLRTLEFISCSSVQKPNMCSLVQTEKVSKLLEGKKRSNQAVVHYIPTFLENVPHILLGMLKKGSLDCTDSYYWQLRSILYTYYACRKVCEDAIENSEVEHKLAGFTTHFYCLLKKIRILFPSAEDMPSSLHNAFSVIDRCLMYKLPERTLRVKFMKKFGEPIGFFSEDSTQLFFSVQDVYNSINMFAHLTSPKPDMNNLKLILNNLKIWMPKLTEQSYKSMFGVFMQNIKYSEGISEMKKIKLQLQDAKVIKADDNDDIVEICQTPAETFSMSDNKLAADIQLLPLLDYLFIVYNAELLTKNPWKFNFNALLRIGSNYLAINPKYLACMLRQEQCELESGRQVAYLYLLASFFNHIRHGFSSAGLHLLHQQPSEDGVVPAATPTELSFESIWSKQSPLLSYICSYICNKSSDSFLMCHSPLRNHNQKILQLETTKAILWKNYDKFFNPALSFRCQSALMVMTWFYRLISCVLEIKAVKLTEELFTKDNISDVFKSSQLSSVIRTKSGLDVLGACFDSFLELKTMFTTGAHENPIVMWMTSKTYILVGLLTTMLLFPKDGIDPIVKLNNKAKALNKQLRDLLTEMGIRNWTYQTASGQQLDEISAIASPPYVKGLHSLYRTIESTLVSLSKRLVCRDYPDKVHPLKFEGLRDLMDTYSTGIGSPENIIDILSQLDQLYHSNSIEKKSAGYECVRKSENLVQNQKHFIETLTRKFVFYEDITIPFVVGVEQVRYGLELACQCIIQKEMNFEFQHKRFKTISDFLSQFVSTYRSPFHSACLLLNGENIETFKQLLSVGNTPAKSSTLIFKLVKSAILEIINEIKLKQFLDEGVPESAVQKLSTAFSYLWNIWNWQEIKIKEKKELEESLFVHKVKHHEGELTEEEEMEKKLAATFPTYKKEFADCIEANYGDEDDAKKDLKETAVDDEHLTTENMFEVWQLHAAAMSILSPGQTKTSDSDWNRHDNKSIDCITPYLLRHEVVCEIVKSMPEKLDMKLDSVLIDGLVLMCNELQKIPSVENQFYDIYKDPNPAEVVTLHAVLSKLDHHLRDLLKEFPEHAQLVYISKLVNRVLSFPITDPLMKFVVGMELILESIQLWEQVAHSKISLQLESEEITRKIIQYRALELDGWRKGLESVIRKQYVNSSKWWFYMFNVISLHDKDSQNDKGCDSVINALKQCLEDSPLGEFPARLSILQSYLLQAKLSESTSSNRKLTRLLYNLYSYYEQFLPEIKNRILQIRKPIDKEVKDYVKIARWNDINFYTVRLSVEKSHRFVVKHVKAFEDALKLPVKQAFSIPSKKDLENGDAPTWCLEIKQDDFLCSDTGEESISLVGNREEPLFQKLPHYHSRIQKLSKKLAKSFHVVNHINTLNEFSGTVIEALQSVVHDSGKKMCTRAQEKKHALLNIQKKKQMLSTLFKNLRVIGLSYRQGMIYAKNRNENDLLTVPAFEISQLEMLKYDKIFQEMLMKSAQDTSHYFYKSIAQFALLQKCIENPSKDLNLDVIHRIKGYSGSLVCLVMTQRQSVVRVSKMIDRIGCFLETLSTLQKSTVKEKYVLLPPQKEVNHREEMLSGLLVHFMTVLGQFGALMNCAPQPRRERNEDIPCLNVGSSMLSNIYKNDSGWSRVMNAISECAIEIEKHFQILMSSTQNAPGFATWEKFFRIVDGYKILTAAIDNILSVISRSGFAQEQPLTANLYALCMRIRDEFTEATHARNVIRLQSKVVQSEQNSPKEANVIRIIQSLTKEVLLGYQDVIANCVVSDKESVSEDVCPDNLFTAKISTYLSELETCLRLQKVSKLVVKLKKAILCSNNSVEDVKSIHGSLRLLTHLMPFLNQYFQLVKVYFTTCLGMHRTSCKFLTVLLEVFNILASKGFCIPADLQDEIEKSGATKFEDIEAGGLGEGEGTKDVSNTIESEDQLEDAFKEGQDDKKENEDDSDIKDEKQGIEMSNDFEGKSFNPDENDEEESEDSGKEEEGEELEKQMGDVDVDDAEKLDDQVWGSDSEDEDENMNDESESGGVVQNKPSELAAKDGQDKEIGKEKESSKNPEETAPESQNDDEYQGDVPDPLIDAPPDQEPEVVELPDEMEIDDDKGGSDNEQDDSVEIQYDPDEALESKDESEEMDEAETGNEKDDTNEDDGKKAENETKEEIKNANTAEPTEENAEDAENKENDTSLPTHTPTNEVQALPSADAAKSSSQDPIQDDTVMEWDSGAQQKEDEQHKEGQADSKNALEQGAAHEGQKSSMKQKSEQEQTYKPKLKSPAEKRTLDDDMDNQNAKHRPIADKQSIQKSLGSEEPEDMADVYEHVPNKEEGTSKAVDIATEEQAAIRPVESQGNGPTEEDEVIELSSDDEDEYYPREETSKGRGDAPLRDQRRKPGERGDDVEEIMDTSEGEVIKTHTVARGESVIHTQHELWSSMMDQGLQERRSQMEKDLELFTHASKESQPSALDMWRSYETLVRNLAQELCEQLRLVLEPTKMSKLKGDYRTGKRLNMRKIIPYIASQFRKDKIWLRRTKPSKRQYQIMLAVDDSSSMSDNHSKQLAFESFATIGHSLSLVEAGELAVVRFGEKVDLLMGFNEQYNTSTGAKVFEQLSFSQTKTSYIQLLHYATRAMVQVRTSSAMKSKETAQLLVIISDGRGIFSEGEEAVQKAVRRARNNNIFTVFLIIDNPMNKDSVLDLTTATFVENNKVIIKRYLEKFPFPFYIILRDISTLPLVLGEALRQWFELVTLVER